MATPAAVNYGAQYGIESAPGSAVTANTDFRALAVTISPVVETGRHRPSGSRFVSTVYATKEHSQGQASGVPCWNDIAPFFTWAAGDPNTVANADETVTRSWTLGSGTTRTIEYGDRSTGYGARITGAFLQSFTMEFGRVSGDSTVSANILGGVFEDGITMDSITTSPNVHPITASNVSVYIDDSLANIGQTKLVDALSVSLDTGDIRVPSWTLDASEDSFSDVVESPMEDANLSLRIKATDSGRAFLDDLRAGSKKYIRIEATGDDIGTASAVQTLHVDFCVSSSEHTREEDEAVYAVNAGLVVTEDADGFSHQFTVISDS